jgi:hypothetical protein
LGVLTYRYLFNGPDDGRDRQGLAARKPAKIEEPPKTAEPPKTTKPPQTLGSGTASGTTGAPYKQEPVYAYSRSLPSTTLVRKDKAGPVQADALPAGPPILRRETTQGALAKNFEKRGRMDSLQLSFTAPADYVADSLRPDRYAFENTGTNHIFIGKVIDSNNRPIPFATISINNRRQTASTDHNGNFSFQLLGSPDSLAPVMVSSAGYHPASLTLNAFTPNTNNAFSNVVRLQPEGRALNEVVTIGYGSQRKAGYKRIRNDDQDKENYAGNSREAPNENMVVQHAAPVAGWTAFQDYLAKHKPISGLDSSAKGNEIISFQVDRKGRLSAFRVQQSLSTAHDSLLIRLVRQGPAWKPLEGTKGSAIVSMSF